VRRTRIGIEQELVTSDALTGGVVTVDRVRTATSGASYGGHLTFEPGGQVELGLPCAVSPEAIVGRLRTERAALAADCARAGVLLEPRATDDRDVPLQLHSPRYLAMQAHFDTIGPAGRRMMRQTASTQVCLDWWPGTAGLEQWHVLHLVGPFLAAAFARPGGRLATWLEVDPDRTAFDGRLLEGDPKTAYTRFAAGAVDFLGDPGAFLSTLFPPVRPRGTYLEVRWPDAQPDAAPLVGVLASVMYDDALRGQVLRMLRGTDLGHAWRAAASDCPQVLEQGRELLTLVGVREEVAVA
jgi:glutamate--cysteine ligase